MSAFIVDDNSINGIINHMGKEEYIETIWSELEELGINKDKLETLAQAMLDLNYSSVNQRYREDEKAPKIERKDVKISTMQAYKSLKCFLYQSCEGDCTEKPLYKILNAYKDHLAVSIVGDLPEYNAAAWN